MTSKGPISFDNSLALATRNSAFEIFFDFACSIILADRSIPRTWPCGSWLARNADNSPSPHPISIARSSPCNRKALSIVLPNCFCGISLSAYELPSNMSGKYRVWVRGVMQSCRPLYLSATQKHRPSQHKTKLLINRQDFSTIIDALLQTYPPEILICHRE